jgi:hypothetical protein
MKNWQELHDSNYNFFMEIQNPNTQINCWGKIVISIKWKIDKIYMIQITISSLKIKTQTH